MSEDLKYDYAIIGAGAAGMHLAHTMLSDPWFADKQIVILEKERKDSDDRTWCFWEKGIGKWDSIVAKSWNHGLFNTSAESIDLHLLPYRYKMIHAIDFYNHGKAAISQAKNMHWLTDDIHHVVAGDTVEIHGKKGNYLASHVFDSRIDKSFDAAKDDYYRVVQHFKGWVIETKEPVFDPDTFVMMDYRVKWRDSTSFTYVLPTSPNSAMVEFTLFNMEFIDMEMYDQLLRQYISEILKIEDFKISKVEYGIIPMSNYPFHQANARGISKIGTAGSWVKPSSGYAFKNIEKKASQLVINLKKGRKPSKGLISKRFRFYDTIFLDILSHNNQLGETVFETMYRKNSIQQIFKFLDEETSLLDELRIISSFDPRPFLKSLVFYLFKIRL